MLQAYPASAVPSREVEIIIGSKTLHGQLTVPRAARGLVMFIHGSGSSRHSPRNQQVAAGLQQGGLATLLFDLLTPREESFDLQTAGFRFDIPHLTQRVLEVTDWVSQQEELATLPIGYFGASTGAAAALVAAALRPAAIDAVVSRGGRPDLAGDELPLVEAPTLLIVGSKDPETLKLNEQAIVQMRCEREMRIVPGATHLFEERGALERVTQLARGWFKRYLGTQSAP
jgi:pimeloyl-ACP methyl ester carboxylesterase